MRVFTMHDPSTGQTRWGSSKSKMQMLVRRMENMFKVKGSAGLSWMAKSW